MNEAMTAVVEVLGLLGWVVGHSLWQGALVGAVLWGLLRVCRGPEKRYWLSCGAMGVLMVMVGATAVYLGRGVTVRVPEPVQTLATVPETAAGEIQWVGTVAPGGLEAGVREREIEKVTGVKESAEVAVDWVGVATVGGGVLWLAGVVGMVGVQVVGWRRLGRAMAGEEHAELTAVAERLMKKMGIRRRVRVLVERSWELGPGVVGWIKPVVLVPVSCATGLSAAQLEAVLAHELAHVKRNDYVVNLLVTVVETVLFHHPAVWWMGRVIRCERELCCDDLAREVCGGGRELAGALERMEEMRLEVGHRLVMGAGGVDGGEGSGLLERVRRLMGRMEDPMDVRVSKAVWMASAGGVVLVAVGCLAGKGDAKASAQSKPAEVATTTEQAVVVGEVTLQPGGTPFPAREEVAKSLPPLETGSGFTGQQNAAEASDVLAPGQADLGRQLAALDAAKRELTIARSALASQAAAMGQSAAAARDSWLKDEARLAGIQAQGQANIEVARQQLETARADMARSSVERYPAASGQSSGTLSGAAVGSTEIGVPERSPAERDVQGRVVVAAEAYRIVPGDVVQVTVGDLGRPGTETFRTVRVNELGQIQLPGVEWGVGLAGKSEEEARKVIAELYSAAGVKVKSADVTVSVVERKGWVVLVVGEVATPGELILSKPEVRLLDVMARVKGATERAGGTVIVVSAGGERREVRIAELMQGKVEADVPVRAGDRVIVPGRAVGQSEGQPGGGKGGRMGAVSGMEGGQDGGVEVPGRSFSNAEWDTEAKRQLELSRLNTKLRDLVSTKEELKNVVEELSKSASPDAARVDRIEKVLGRITAEQNLISRSINQLKAQTRSGFYYMGGSIQRTGAYQLSHTVTLKQAIISAGYTLPPDTEGVVSVQKRSANGETETSEYNLRDVFSGKHDDVNMVPDMTVLVSAKTSQNAAESTPPATQPSGEAK